MENISDALKMSFAIFAFIVAASIAASCIAGARRTSDAVLAYADKTNYYQYTASSDEYMQGRKVSVDVVISNIYRCAKEHFAVKVITSSDEEIFDLENITLEELQAKIDAFVKANIKKTKQYYETLIEITTSGNYREAEDGTQITITPGAKKIFLVYEEL